MAKSFAKMARLFRLLKEGVETGVFPGAVAGIHYRDRDYFLAVGYRALIPSREFQDEDTIYDLASLTKPLATTLAIMKWVGEGRLGLSTPLVRVLPEAWFENPLWRQTPISALLTHTSGLPDYRPYFKTLFLPEGTPRKIALFKKILSEKPSYPPGQRALYSDLGFFLLGAVVEQVGRKGLLETVREIYAEIAPEVVSELTYLPLEAGVAPERIAPTERCPFRKKLLRGEVHDENTWVIGGVSGTAGLFGTARAVLEVLKGLLLAYHGEEERGFLSRDLVQAFWDFRQPQGTWALGFDRPYPGGASSAGPFFPRKALGHLGYTGTSFWLDPHSGLVAVLLTNRVHPSRENLKIKAFRPRFYTEVALCFLGRD